MNEHPSEQPPKTLTLINPKELEAKRRPLDPLTRRFAEEIQKLTDQGADPLEIQRSQLIQNLGSAATMSDVEKFYEFNPALLRANIGFKANDLENYKATFTKSDERDRWIRGIQRVLRLAVQSKSLPKSYIHELILDAARAGNSEAVHTLLSSILEKEATESESQALETTRKLAREIAQKKREETQTEFDRLYVNYQNESIFPELGYWGDSPKKVQLLKLADSLVSCDKMTATLEDPKKPVEIHKDWTKYHKKPASVAKDAKKVPQRPVSAETVGSAPALAERTQGKSSHTGVAAYFARWFGGRQSEPTGLHEALLGRKRDGYHTLVGEDGPSIQGEKPPSALSSQVDMDSSGAADRTMLK